MKTFLIWLCAAVVAFSVIFTGAHSWYASHPAKILILVDTSFAMDARSFDVMDRLEGLMKSRYGVFSVGDFTRPLPEFSADPALPAFVFYGPRPEQAQIQFIASRPETAEADRIVVITNRKDSGAFRFSPKVEIIGLPPLLD
jgi:hypothetical protein